MTPEELHKHYQQEAVSDISYKAVCTVDAVCAFREWIEPFLAAAYEKGFQNALTKGKNF